MLKKYACMTKWQIFLLGHFLSIQNSMVQRKVRSEPRILHGLLTGPRDHLTSMRLLLTKLRPTG
jgi:hypothetical protein